MIAALRAPARRPLRPRQRPRRGAGVRDAVRRGVRLWLMLGEHMALLGTSRGEATTDPLTGLRNRRALVNDLDEQIVRRVAAAPAPAAALRPQRLQGLQRSSATSPAMRCSRAWAAPRRVGHNGRAYRLGGDEFCVLPRRRPPARRDRARLRPRRWSNTAKASRSPPPRSACHPRGGRQRSDAQRLADQRLYENKSGGRGNRPASTREGSCSKSSVNASPTFTSICTAWRASPARGLRAPSNLPAEEI